MFELNSTSKITKKRKRVGRGGSRGGTSGKGHKGQKARSGGSVGPRFEGGQMPLYRRLPKRGFNNANFKKEVLTVNLQRLEDCFEDGQSVTLETMAEKGLINLKRSLKGRDQFLIKILGNGTLTKKLTVHADAFSGSAKNAIEQVGGQAQIIKEL